MIRLTRPTVPLLTRYLAQCEHVPVCTTVAAIPDPPPDGFHRNHHRGCLGSGEETFAAAKLAVSQWKQFPGGWVDVFPNEHSSHLGQTVSVVARCLGLWTVNACRVIDFCETSTGGISRFAITYATLANHMLEGAECFAVEWDRFDGRVWYDLSSYARPSHWLARTVLPYVRRLQRRFAEDSHAALRVAMDVLQQTSRIRPILS